MGPWDPGTLGPRDPRTPGPRDPGTQSLDIFFCDDRGGVGDQMGFFFESLTLFLKDQIICVEARCLYSEMAKISYFPHTLPLSCAFQDE